MTADNATSSVGDWQPVVLPGARTRTVRAASNGNAYQVSLWTPDSAPPPDGYPVVYVLDGNAMFGSFVEAVRRSSRRPDATGICPAAVVGIGMLGTGLYDNTLRQADFTPGPAADAAPAAPGTVGGADAFLSFLQDELAPTLWRDHPIDPARQTLVGHSLAGLFVLHVLTAQPRFFHTFAAISPSHWWNPPALQARLAALAGSPARVFLAVGQWEGALPPWQQPTADVAQIAQRRGQRQMVAGAHRLAGELQALLGPGQVAFHEFPDEDHASVVAVAGQRALRFALAPAGGQRPATA